MTGVNRGRLSVDTGGKWHLYTATALPGAEVLGTVTRGIHNTGALMRITRTGAYVQVNAGAARSLDGRKVAAALGTAGRPAEITGGRAVNVYLDADSISAAQALGRGSVSAGIRAALKQHRD
jgi:hypothetical protein